jgi:hypothetical protein
LKNRIVQTDLLVRQRCPHCGCLALHPEAHAQRLGSFERMQFFPDTQCGPAFVRTVVYVIECGVCRGLWEIPFLGVVLRDGEMREWIAHSPSRHQPLPT